jgi:hypothetical protein
MWKPPGYYDDPFNSPNPQTEPGTLFRWANRIVRPVRFSGRRLTPLKVCLTFLLIGCLLLAQDWLPRIPHSRVSEHNFPALSLFPQASSLIRTLFRIPARSTTPLLFLEPHFNHPNQQNIEFQTLSTPLRRINSGRHAMSPLLIFTLHSVHSVRIEHRC